MIVKIVLQSKQNAYALPENKQHYEEHVTTIKTAFLYEAITSKILMNTFLQEDFIMEAKLMVVKKYILSRISTKLKVLDKAPVPIRSGGKGIGSAPSPYAELNFNRRKKQRADTVREKCLNSFTKDTAIFVTLTFDTQKCPGVDLTDIKQTNELFNRFIKRVSRRFNDFCYVAAFDKCGDGNWHYHMMCNLPVLGKSPVTIQELSDIWQYGIVDISIIDTQDYFENCIGYLNRNMVNNADEKHGIKGYLASQNAQSNIILSSAKYSDRQDFQIVDSIVKQFPLSLVYRYIKFLGYAKNLGYPNHDIIDFIQDYERTFTKVPHGYKEIKMLIKVFSSSALFPNFFRTPFVAVRKQSAPKQVTRVKTNQPANKHSANNNQTPP